MAVPDHVIRVLPETECPTLSTVEHVLDERRLRAFAAAVGDLNPAFFDLEVPEGITAHPLFPVCLEWPLIEQGPPEIELSQQTANNGLHLRHHVEIHGALRPGQRVRTAARLRQATARDPSSALLVTEFHTCSDGGQPLITTRLTALYRGVQLHGERTPMCLDEAPMGPPGDISNVAQIVVTDTDAVVYSECSGIWNPIHTDIRAARAAGLPNTPLHGTATLARAVSSVLASGLTPADPRVQALSCRFSRPVYPGMTLTVAAGPGTFSALEFEVRGPEGPVIKNGVLDVA